MRSLLIALLLPVAAWAEGDRAGAFDYYVMALSWSPNWCDREGGDSPQCAPERDLGWILHGLWPQHEVGWPSDCRTGARNPSRAETGAMADIMGSGGLAWHQWKKHGRCSGLSSRDYFALSREAYGRVTRPEVFRRLGDTVKLPARVVEEAFLEANPALSADMLTVTCKNRQIQEVRICLTRDLSPRICGRDVRRDCTQSDALLHPIP